MVDPSVSERDPRLKDDSLPDVKIDLNTAAAEDLLEVRIKRHEGIIHRGPREGLTIVSRC